MADAYESPPHARKFVKYDPPSHHNEGRMDDVTRRQVMKLAAASGVIAAGAVSLGATEVPMNPLNPTMPIQPNRPVPLSDDEKKKRQRAKSLRATDEEGPLDFSWMESGVNLVGRLYVSEGVEPRARGRVSGAISGDYDIKANHSVRITDDLVRNAIEVALVQFPAGDGYVSARSCRSGPFGVHWWCGPWQFLAGWYGREAVSRD
jgi:hypothetical protein